MRLQTVIFPIAFALAIPAGAESPDPQPQDDLHRTILELDAAAFDAFNRCSDLEQLAKHAEYFAPDVEFYHDSGGVTWTRDAMLANTRKYVCGVFRRELVEGTLRVFPIKDFGALSLGSHRFCQLSTNSCEGLADFTMVWRHKDGVWQVTRVLSYGHRAAGGGSRHRLGN